MTVLTAAEGLRDQRPAAAPAAAGLRPGDRLLVGTAPLPRTSTGKVRRPDLPGVLGLGGG